MSFTAGGGAGVGAVGDDGVAGEGKGKPWRSGSENQRGQGQVWDLGNTPV